MERPGRLALITGASSGIGAEFARQLAENGYDLILVARRSDRLERLAADLHARFGIQVECLVADLSSPIDLQKVAERVRSEERLELLVNNAGFGTLGFFFESDLESQVSMHRLHVLATLVLTHAALGELTRRDRGGIINVSSVAAYSPSAAAVSYNSTKSWMNSFTESVHLELKSLGSKVRIEALCPGFTLTEFHDNLGLDRSKLHTGSGFWMPAERVVRDSLEGLERGKWCVVPGWRYKILVFVLRHLPIFLRHRAALMYGGKARSFLAGARK